MAVHEMSTYMYTCTCIYWGFEVGFFPRYTVVLLFVVDMCICVTILSAFCSEFSFRLGDSIDKGTLYIRAQVHVHAHVHVQCTLYTMKR